MSSSAPGAGGGHGTPARRTVLFHRNYQRFQGGHLKVFHYFEHVRSSPRFEARIRFSADSVWDHGNPWAQMRDAVVGEDEPVRADIQFLAGMDWRQLDPAQRAHPGVPVFHMLQALRHARPGDPAYEFLAHPAIRICVSPELEQALREDPTVNGPVFAIPVAVDLERLPAPRAAGDRDIECLLLAMKDRPLGREVAKLLRRGGCEVHLLEQPLERPRLLDAMARARVSVHITKPLEGAYLPALECMALQTAVVCPDAVGNRSFCRDGDTCLMPAREPRAIADAALRALSAAPDELAPMLLAGRAESESRGLAAERERLLAILARAEELWAQI